MGEVASFKSVALGGLGGRVDLFGGSDPMGSSKFFYEAFQGLEPLRQGMVVYYNPSTHTAQVLVFGVQSEWPCIVMDEPLSFSFGFSATYPPREGDVVLVQEMMAGARCGIIIGRVPNFLIFNGSDDYKDPDQYHRRLYTQDDLFKRTWDLNIPGMMKPMYEKYDNSTHLASHFRPTDVYPGEFAHVNQHNCGIKGGMFSATLLGGGASLRMSALSNLARLTCESYQRYSMSGSMHEFHNGRYLSSERNFALYQEERLGWYKPDSGNFSSNVWTKDSEAPSEGENQTMRPRVKELTGFFGNLISRYCLRPDPDDTDIRVQEIGEINEAGVSRETIDPSGQYRLSAAGMIAIERTGRIPVPVRMAYPTDNKHDIGEGLEKLRLEPFEHDDGDPGYRQLELYDRQAYDLKNQYARVDGLGVDVPDYDVPDETDLKPLEDKYDKEFTNSETVKLNKYDKRRAGVYIGEDGSIIMRDAWGSEIVMLGGNVSISCAGNVMLLPGQTALTIAGDDIVQKAQNSIDMHASEHDVRLSAARNMEILGGADEDKYQGGVIIESRGKSTAPWDGEDKGEDARVSGITLMAKNQAVVVCGEKLNMRSKKDTRILSGESSMDGNISIAAGNIRSRSSKNTILVAPDSSLMLSSGNALIASESACVSGTGSATIFNGSRVPGMWIDAGGAGPGPQELGDLQDENKASFGFDLEALEKMIFGFRSSIECRTNKSWTMGATKGAEKFTLYEPAWVQVMKIFETLRKGNVEADDYKEDGKWENGWPFPGEDAKSTAVYAQLDGLKPKNLTSEGFNANRIDVERSSTISTGELLNKSYKVRKP